jgi:hypothetical protein
MKKEKKKEYRENRKEQLKEERKNKLIKALNKKGQNGLELRSDSMLCAKFINNNKDLRLKDVIERMCQMHYINIVIWMNVKI